MQNKILYVTYMGLTEPLVESQALAYLKGLSKRGNSICILSFEKEKLISEKRIQEIREELDGLNINWTFLKYHKRPIFFAKALDLFAGFIICLWIILTKDIRIIHTRGSMPAFFGFFAARILGRRFIFDVRGLMAKEYIDGKIWNGKGFYYKVVNRLEKIILKYSDADIVLTQRIKDIISNRFYMRAGILHKISVIPSSVDTVRFKVMHKNSSEIKKRMGLKERFIFLYTGSMGTWYMFEEMAKFVYINRQNFNEPFFLIVTQSDGEFAEAILRRIGFKDMDYSVMRSDHKDMPLYINLANAAMMFIRPCFSKKASSPTKFAEYLACGIPVILNSGIGDCDKIVKNYNIGVLVERFSERDYFTSGLLLKKLLEEQDIAQRCREAAEKEFSLNDAVDRYNRIYKSL